MLKSILCIEMRRTKDEDQRLRLHQRRLELLRGRLGRK
ncbi:hypothetical protein FF1_026463 [Malus domestica]